MIEIQRGGYSMARGGIDACCCLDIAEPKYSMLCVMKSRRCRRRMLSSSLIVLSSSILPGRLLRSFCDAVDSTDDVS